MAPMSESPARPAATGIVDRIQENLLAYFRQFAGLPGMTVADRDVVWFVNARAEPDNHVLRARISADAAEARITEIMDEIGRHTDHIDWLVFPSCRPADLGKRLRARGMSEGPGGTWMSADLASPSRAPSVPEGFRVARVTGDAMLDQWKRVSAAGFDEDAQIYYDAYARHGFGSDAISLHYIGYLGDEPVTSSTLLLAGGIAGIYNVSTPPSFRGRGFGSAITVAMMQEARQRGHRDAWTWASEMGKGVYSKIGFVAADFGIREYQWRNMNSSYSSPIS
jgi:GNAT superfamily N-acetyltransferase